MLNQDDLRDARLTSDKRELLEACARATGRTIVAWTDLGHAVTEEPSGRTDTWTPIDSTHDCGEMEAQMRVNLRWNKAASNINAYISGGPLHTAYFADHASPQAARRMAVCRAVAARKE